MASLIANVKCDFITKKGVAHSKDITMGRDHVELVASLGTGLFAVWVNLYVSIEATFVSAIPQNIFTDLWVSP